MKRALAAACALLAVGCSTGQTRDDWLPVKKDDLVLAVEVTGTLQSTRSKELTPPMLADTWQFKIARMADEGKSVKQGDAVLSFDASELQRKMAERVAARDAAEKEIGRKENDLAIARRDIDLRLAEALASARKTAMKADRPAGVTASMELKLAGLDADLARKEVANIQTKLDYSTRSARAELRALHERFDRAQARVKELEDTIARMTVRAPSDGTVVYPLGWRDQKKKVGDTAWRGETVMEIADLAQMEARGEVDEMDVSRVAVGQPITFRLDAHPDVEFAGKVKKIADTVQRQSPKNPLKVLRVIVALDKTDPVRMRPGMRFIGKVETDRLAGATVVPSEAVFPRPDGPVAFRRDGLGFSKVPLKLGRRNSRWVEVLGGLAPGDAVAPRDLDRQRGKRS